MANDATYKPRKISRKIVRGHYPITEKHLYFQYHEHFDEVAPFLERLLKEAPDEAGETWGRIATLASLSEHIGQNDLFRQLESANLASAWMGASQVFAANLDHHLRDALCINGLRRILERQNLDEKVYRTIERSFTPNEHGRLLDREFAFVFIGAIRPDDQAVGLHDFIDWIGDLAGRDPVAALEICERLTVRLDELGSHHRMWHTEPLITALSSILREADETDDAELIRRAVRLQDQFLRMDISGMDDYFKAAGQV